MYRHHKIYDNFIVDRNRIITENQILFKQRFLDLDLSSILLYLEKQFETSSGLTTLAQIFSLVNICVVRQKLSYGICPKPSNKLFTPSSTLVFTFSLKNSKYKEEAKALRVKRLMRNCFLWSDDHNIPDRYLTINIRFFDVKSEFYSLLRVKYMFYVMALTTRSVVKKHAESKYRTSDYYVPYQSIYNQSVVQTLFKENKEDWFYSYSIWKYLPNILNPSLLTSRVVTYYFLYINMRILKEGRAFNDRFFNLLSNHSNSIKEFLIKSIKNYTEKKKDLVLLAAIYTLEGNTLKQDVRQKLDIFGKQLDLENKINGFRFDNSKIETLAHSLIYQERDIVYSLLH